MRPHRDLAHLSASASRRIDRLRAVATRIAAPIGVEEDARCAYTIIELANLWSTFCKSYFLSWCMGTRLGSGGKVISASPLPTSFKAAIKAAYLVYVKKTPRAGRQEPPWHDPALLPRLANAFDLSIKSQIGAAMSVPGTALQNLATVRNFFAHRCEDTAVKLPGVARKLGLPPHRTGSRIVLAVSSSGRASVLTEWLNEIDDRIDFLCD